jgi:hypothetical protein
MKDSFLICSFPRSRTLWLSKFLTIPGVSVTTHEATEYAASAEEFWKNADDFCDDSGTFIYGNSDSANIFVLPSMLAERPLTRTVWIARPIGEVFASMEGAGFELTDHAVQTLTRLRDEYQTHLDMTIDYQALNSMDTCRALWEFVLPGVAFDVGRWGMYAPCKIAYTKANPPGPRKTDKFLSWIKEEMIQWPMIR